MPELLAKLRGPMRIIVFGFQCHGLAIHSILCAATIILFSNSIFSWLSPGRAIGGRTDGKVGSMRVKCKLVSRYIGDRIRLEGTAKVIPSYAPYNYEAHVCRRPNLYKIPPDVWELGLRKLESDERLPRLSPRCGCNCLISSSKKSARFASSLVSSICLYQDVTMFHATKMLQREGILLVSTDEDMGERWMIQTSKIGCCTPQPRP